jgi:D-alanyl-D-alanine endopeptidase (penicillin-binding protein 7)
MKAPRWTVSVVLVGLVCVLLVSDAVAEQAAAIVVPRYKVDAAGDLVPDVRAAAAIIYHPETGEVLWEENSRAQRSIASLTKLMTAIVVLDNALDLSKRVTIVRSDVSRASTTFLRTNDSVMVGDLLHLLLIASDNAAARALARVSPQGPSGFIARMNQRAVELGLKNTRYAEPSGLEEENLSSAYDIARLLAYASTDERLSSIMRKRSHTVQTLTRTMTFKSTNHLLEREELDVMAGKTGFIREAGYCAAVLLRMPHSGQEVAVVVLGARSNTGRFSEMQNMLNWVSAKQAVFATTTPLAR